MVPDQGKNDGSSNQPTDEAHQPDQGPPDEKDGEDSKPKDGKKESSASILPKVVMIAVIIGVLLAAAFYFRQPGGPEEQALRLQEVEIPEIRAVV